MTLLITHLKFTFHVSPRVKDFFSYYYCLHFKLCVSQYIIIAVTRMRVEGAVTVTFNVVLKDLFKLGYDNGEKK